VEVETIVLMDSEGEDEDNLHFLQTLRQVIALTPQIAAKSTPLTILSSSKPSSYKFVKKK
jgi:hypothetical protein